MRRGGAGTLAVSIIGALAAVGGGVPAAQAASACSLGPGGAIKHVVILQFDNVHLERDNPNVPSDIEQIPALDNYITGNGSMLANDHTVLISHTSDGIVSTETGLYPDDNGLNVGNSYPYIDPNQTGTGTSSSVYHVPGTSGSSAFKYWNDPTSGDDPLYTLIAPGQVNTPAPWVAFTRAGCDFAGVGSADMELENDTTDVSQVFGGTSSPQYAMGNWSFNTAFGQHNTAGSDLGTTDLEGLAIHCSAADSTSGVCANGQPDALPTEGGGGYTGYKALFGASEINPWLTGQADQPEPASFTPAGDTAPPAGNWQAPPIYDVFAPNATNSGASAVPVANADAQTVLPPMTYTPGATDTSQILDAAGNPGFPGFNGMEANNALGYTAALQEAGVPITYTYLSDVHDDQYDLNHDNAYGPGEAGEENQLRAYNAAFTAFFARLTKDNITKANTVFLVTVDEGDHYSGGPPLNPGCNGVTTPCQYDTAEAGGAAYGTAGYQRNVGEIDTNLPALVPGVTGDNTKFGFDDDDAPAIVVPNQTSPSGTRPGPTDPAVRGLERELGTMSEFDPIDGAANKLMDNEADETEEGILHETDADPNRLPTFTLFGNPDFFFQGSCGTVGVAQGQPNAPVTNEGPGCPAQGLGFAWNHGDDQPEIASTWQGWVGPGIQNLGETSSIWTDHADARPTLLTLLGLRDDYASDGRAVDQILGTNNLTGGASGVPADIAADRPDFEQLAAAYKQVNAPFGAFGLDTLKADTTALVSQSDGDSFYNDMSTQLQACEAQRQALAPQIQAALAAAEQGTAPMTGAIAAPLIDQANALVSDAQSLQTDTSVPNYTVCGAQTTAPGSPTNTTAPTVTGTPAVGDALTCNPGVWTGSPTLSEQWLRDAAPIVSALGSGYTLVNADVGHQISCVVTAGNASGTSSATTSSVGPVLAAAPGTVTVTVGAAVAGSLSLSLANSLPSLGTLVPGVAQTYQQTLAATITTTSTASALTIQDPSSIATGHLANGPFSLASPLQVDATDAAHPTATPAPLGAGPLTLISGIAASTADPVTIGFAQPVSATETLHTGSYSKTLTISLSTTTP